MDKLRADLIQTYRTIRARPSATAATVLVVGLGIGLTSAMFDAVIATAKELALS